MGSRPKGGYPEHEDQVSAGTEGEELHFQGTLLLLLELIQRTLFCQAAHRVLVPGLSDSTEK